MLQTRNAQQPDNAILQGDAAALQAVRDTHPGHLSLEA